MTTPWIIAFLILCGVVLLLVVILLGTLRRITGVLERAEAIVGTDRRTVDVGGLSIGEHVPPFEVRDESGALIQSSDLVEAMSVILFIDSDCKPCDDLVKELAEDGDATNLPLIVITDDARARSALPRSISVFVQSDRSASDAFHSIGTPQAFLVSPDLVIRDRTFPNSAARLKDLADRQEGGEYEGAVVKSLTA